MDFPCTQIIADENECSSSSTLNHSSQYQAISRKQVGILTIGPVEYPIYSGVNTIGRDPASNIHIADSTVSKRHSEIEASSSRAPAWICDLDSSNKTRLNNAVLRPGRYYELKEDSAIYFGRVRATYRYHQALNESVVAETPVVDRRRKPLEEKVVAETPDSSLNNSSGLAGDVSAIPATQDYQSTFRTPPLPHQQQPVRSVATTSVLTSSPKNDSFAEATSSTSDRNICPDSDDEASTCEVSSRNESLGQTTSVQERTDFLPDSDDEANISETETHQREQPVTSITSTLPTASKNDSSVAAISCKAPPDYPSCSKGISIHDMETQEHEELIDNLRASAAKKLPRNYSVIQSDIHDMETQIDDLVVHHRKRSSIVHSPRNYSPDRESEHQERNNIDDMETQKPEEIIDHVSENASKELPLNRNERQFDIHDMETQKDDSIVDYRKKRSIVHSPRNYSPNRDSERQERRSIYDMETQKPEEIIDHVSENASKELPPNCNRQVNIHDMETQKDDLPVNTAKKCLIVHSSRYCDPDSNSEPEKQVSIYDLETQKPFQAEDGQVSDIHDMETQNVFLDHASKSQTNTNSRNEIPIDTDTADALVDNEQISSRESQANAEDIYDKETQCPDDVALIMSRSPSISPEQNHVQNDKVISTSFPHGNDRQPETNSDCTSQMVTQEINNENVNSEILNSKTQKSKNGQAVTDSFNKDVGSKKNTTFPESLDEPTSPPQELLKLSLEANFEEDCKELDVSVCNMGSQNLLENFAAEEVQKHLSMTSPDRPSSPTNEGLDQYAASSEDDIFNAVTQKAPADEEDIFTAATQRINLKSSKGFESDDSETDEEGVFKNIASNSVPLATKNTEINSKVDKINCNKDKEGVLRLDTCETQKIDMNKSDEHQPDINADNDDDSITDEEGFFTQFIEKANSTTGRASTIEQNVSRQENDNYCHSRDSGDIYDLPTQPIKLSAEERTNFSEVITGSDDENKELDETVTIQKKPGTLEDNVTPIIIKDNAVEKAIAQPACNTDNIAPTQLIHVPAVELPTDGPSCYKTNESVGETSVEEKLNKLETVSDTDDLAPTQVIRVLSNESPLSSSPDLIMAEIQPGNFEEGNISSMCSKERKPETPTSEINSGIDDMGPTQIICDPSDVSPLNSPASSLTLESDPSKSKGGYTSDMDILPTQMIQVPKEMSKTHDCDDLSDGYSSDAPGLYSAQKCGIEDIEYEMAPTQLMSEVDDERNKKATDAKNIKKGSVKKRRGKSIKKAKVNLDDTIERNLNNMFDGVNTEEVDEPSMLSTQSLQKVLQPSQEKLSESPASSSSNVTSNSKVKQSSSQAKATANENTDSQNSENYFSGMKSARKRNVFRDSQDSNDLVSNKHLTDEKVNDEEAIADEVETGSTRERSTQKTSADDVAQICNIKDVNEKQDTKCLLAATDERNIRDEINNDEIAPLLTVNDLFEEYSIPKISESLVRASIIIDDDEVDIMSGLPEVRIAGTASNPPSPTSSVSSRSDISTLSKCNATKSAVKKAFKSRARRRNAKRNVVSVDPKKLPNSFSISLGIGDDLIKKEEQHDKKNAKSYRVTRRSAMNEDVKDPSKAIVLLERLLLVQGSIALTSSQKNCLRNSPKDLLHASFARSTRTRRSSQENDDCSSVFQVAKEVQDVNGGIKASKQNSKPVSTSGRRSLRKRVENEQIDTKISIEAQPEAKARKRKNSDSKEDMDIPNKTRRNSIKNSANTRQSPTIRDFFPKRDSPLTIERPQSPVPLKEKPKSKKSMGNTRKSVASTKAALIDTNPPETANGGTRRNASDVQVTSSKRSLPDDEGRTQFVKNGRDTLLHKLIPNIHPALSEESQEVEMILSRSSLEAKANVEIRNQEAPKQETKGRRGRKRLNPIEIKSNNTNTETRVVSNKKSLPDDVGQAQIVKMHTSTPQRRSASLRKSISNQSTLSEKSEEVEIPLTRSTLESKGNVEVNVKNEEAPKQVTKGRRGRKRLNPNESKSSDKKGSNTSSEVSTSEPPSFEVPVSRPKRAKMLNASITSVDETSLDESKKSTRSNRYSQRSLVNSFSDLSTSTASQSSLTKIRQKILFTGITNTNEYSNILTKLGASQVDETTKCTVLVTDKVRRTVKFLCALAQATPIVSVDWLIESGKMGQFLDIEEFILSDQQSEKKFDFDLRKSLQKAQNRKLLESYTVVLTPNVVQPPISDLKSLISTCGGKPLIRPPARLPEKTIIISNEADMANARKFLAKAPKGVTVQSTEFLLSGILQQELNFTKYKLI